MAKVIASSLIPERFQTKLIIAFVLFATFFGALFVYAVEHSIKTTEDYLQKSYLRGITEQALAEPVPQLPNGYAIKSRLLEKKPEGSPTQLPGFLEYYEDESVDRLLYLTEWPEADKKQILVVELDGTVISDLESQEWPIRWVILSIASMLVLLALLLGASIAYVMSRPLSKLAHSVSRVDTSRPEQPYSGDALYGIKRRDEIGELSRTLNDLLQRTHWVLHQEYSFSHHVSHEFRSPLALIGNAIALIKTTDAINNPVVQNNLRRIENAQQRLHDRIALFQSLGSQSKSQISEQTIDLVACWQSCLHNMQANLAEPLEVIAHMSEQALLKTQSVYIQALFENTIRNAAEHGDGRIEVELSRDHFYIRNGCQSKNSSTHGYGYGLEIVRRVCDKASWGLAIETNKDSFKVCIDFTQC